MLYLKIVIRAREKKFIMRFYNEKAIWLIPIDFAAKNKQTKGLLFACVLLPILLIRRKTNV